MDTITVARDKRKGDDVAISFHAPRVIAICGKRGTGKSFTLGRIIEQVYALRRYLILVVDPLAVFWTTAIPADGSAPIPVRVLVPSDPEQTLTPEMCVAMRSRGVEVERLWLNPSDLSPETWCAFFGFDLREPQGICLFRAVFNLQGQRFTTPQIIDQVQADELAMDNTKQALENRLRLAMTWGIFGDEYREVFSVLRPDAVNVLDVSMFDTGHNSIRNLAVKLVCEHLFKRRFTARRRETLGLTGDTPPIFLAVDEAHDYAPANGNALAKDILIRWSKEGRQPNLALAVASQQPASLTFEILSQADTLVIHKVTLADDVRTVGRLSSTYAQDLPAFLKGLKQVGDCVLVDDSNERVIVARTLPRAALHGGGEAIATT